MILKKAEDKQGSRINRAAGAPETFTFVKQSAVSQI